MKLSPSLSDLPPGVHGFHIHEKPDCGAGMKDGKPTPGLAAGGHFDPENTGRHEGPLGRGHLGDLPSLMVGLDCNASEAVIAPRLKTGEVQDRSLMIHAGGENYSDIPEKLGGGCARVACGIIK